MARPLRLDAPGEFFHVFARGNVRAEIFLDDHDRESFLRLLAEVVDRYDVRCHSYCLMGNHYHLLLQPMRGELPRALRHLNGIYAQGFNRRHRRSGHLFEGRYKSPLVDRQSYLVELARYIVLNPVRAGLVAAPEDWPWSSYRGTAGLAVAPSFLHLDFIRFAAGGREGPVGASDFRALVASARDNDLVLEGRIGLDLALGGRPFLESIGRQVQEQNASLEVPVRQRIVGRPSLDALLLDQVLVQRNERIRAAVLEHRYSQVAVARVLGIGRSTVSRVVRGKASG